MKEGGGHETAFAFKQTQRIGVVSTRLTGTDGVSLETEKWLDVMKEVGLEPYYFAGELVPPKTSFLAELNNCFVNFERRLPRLTDDLTLHVLGGEEISGARGVELSNRDESLNDQ